MLAAFDALPKAPVFKLSTAPVERVLEALGRPQDRLPPVIHVAGTNGKGSTTAFMRAIAEAHGLKVHVDTSPHLVRVNERIRIAGQLISDDALRRYVGQVLEANAGEPLSFFEGMTAASYLAFAETPADLTLVEVGLGGRFDSTNVFRAPRVCVITPIALDHKEFLGRHLAQIAWEKAGIIRPGAQVVSADQTGDVARTIRAEANFQGAALSRLSDHVRVTARGDGQFDFSLGDLHIEGAELALTGPHQSRNAALALLALKKSGLFELTPDACRKGLASAQWPARLQVLDVGPVTQALNGRKVLLDGGHNPHAAAALYDALKDEAPIPIILGMLTRKDSRGFLSALAPIAERVITMPLPGSHNGRDPEELAAIARGLGLRSEAVATLEDALSLANTSTSPTALICGSLYLAGDVLAANGQEIT